MPHACVHCGGTLLLQPNLTQLQVGVTLKLVSNKAESLNKVVTAQPNLNLTQLQPGVTFCYSPT